MKTISLTEFHSKVKELATRANKTVIVVHAELSEYTNYQEWLFRCYIDGYSFHSASTPEAALAKLESQMFPVQSNIEDVVIEAI